jgi:hypothetical protein
MTTLDQPQMTLKNGEAQTALQNGLKGDFAQGIRTLPASTAGPDFARGERTMPPVDEGGPDYARGARTMPPSPEGPDYARGLRGRQGVG